MAPAIPPYPVRSERQTREQEDPMNFSPNSKVYDGAFAIDGKDKSSFIL